MTFTTIKHIAKKTLPTKLYNLASISYNLWIKIFDNIYYSISEIYFYLKRDRVNYKKIKIIKVVKQYSMVGRGGLLATYAITRNILDKRIDGCRADEITIAD